MTTKVIWLAPSPTARGAIRSRALRASGSSSPKCGTKRNPSCRNGGSWTRRSAIEPMTTPIASPTGFGTSVPLTVVPSAGDSTAAPKMIPRL